MSARNRLGSPLAGSNWARDPARRRSAQSTTGYLFSIRSAGGIHVFESRLERDLIELLDIDASVDFSCQPETFHWTGPNGAHRWTPDVLLSPRDGRTRVFIEVKPWDVANADPSLGGRIRGMVEQCTMRGAGFALLTEREIRSGGGLGAAKRVRSCALRCDSETTAHLLSRLERSALPRAFGELASKFADKAKQKALPGLIGLGFLQADLRAGLTATTMISRGPRAWQ